MPEIGQFRIVLHDNADPAAFEAKMEKSRPQMILTRATSDFSYRLLRLIKQTADRTVLGREYIYEVTVWLVGADYGYIWADNIGAVQRTLTNLATVTGVESFTPPIEPETT